MSYSALKVREIVENAISNTWSVPEFQRGFVWKATQVRDLAESLWRDYPIGNVLIWDSSIQRKAVSEKSISDSSLPTKWVVDGQQRTTALCILHGLKPYWWSDGAQWNNVLRSYDIRFDIDAKEEPYFVTANAVIRKVRTNRFVPVCDLLALDIERESDQKKLQALAKDIKSDGLCDGMDGMEVYTRLDRVRKIRDREIVVINVDQDLEEVVEIFARLNSKGTRVKEADIYLGIVAARTPGWVREEFLPFIGKLEQQGFYVTPNRLFQSLTAVGAKSVRFKQVTDDFWNKNNIAPAWGRTQSSWHHALKWLESYGIVTNDILPSDAIFVPASALFERFPAADRSKAFEWMLQALRYGRYSGSATSSLDEDLREIENAGSADEAIERIRRRIRAIEEVTAEEFLRDYSDARFGRLLLYLLAFRNKAVDWDQSGNRIAFRGNELVSGFSPQFHHVFPRGFLTDRATDKPRAGLSAEQIEALANIAIIGAGVNIRISDKEPLAYFAKYEIDEKKRVQQFIEGPVESMTAENYPAWLLARAHLLATVSNSFLAELRGSGKGARIEAAA
jgi:hypothetical protein